MKHAMIEIQSELRALKAELRGYGGDDATVRKVSALRRLMTIQQELADELVRRKGGRPRGARKVPSR